MTYFHGTDADLEIGEMLIPGAALGASNYGRSEHVYFTSSEQVGEDVAISEAYGWARTACMVAEDERDEEGPTAFVYIVEPIGEIEDDGSDEVGEECKRAYDGAMIVGVVSVETLYDFAPQYGSTYLD